MKKCVNGKYYDMAPAEIAEMERMAAEMSVPEPDPKEKRMDEIEAALIELAAMLAGGGL
ncbi:MAG: hypothetical protein J6V25_12590 [Oscillospiraceae bacterium]|nr:hypothetical protein [Oscillospiraceae bacterium]